MNGGSCAPINPDLRNQTAGFGPHTPHSRVIFKKNISCLCVPMNVFVLHTWPFCSGFPFTRPCSQAVGVPRARLPLGGPVEDALHPRPAGGGFSFDRMDAGFSHLLLYLRPGRDRPLAGSPGNRLGLGQRHMVLFLFPVLPLCDLSESPADVVGNRVPLSLRCARTCLCALSRED